MIKNKIIKKIHIEALKMDFHVWVNPPYELVQRTEEYRQAANQVIKRLGGNTSSLGHIYLQVGRGSHSEDIFYKFLLAILSPGPKETRWTREGLQQLSSAIGEAGMSILIDNAYQAIMAERARLN